MLLKYWAVLLVDGCIASCRMHFLLLQLSECRQLATLSFLPNGNSAPQLYFEACTHWRCHQHRATKAKFIVSGTTQHSHM